MSKEVSVCLIKIETVASIDKKQEQGAVASKHPTNPKFLKERERDRGLRIPREISIQTITNTAMSESKEPTPFEDGQVASELPKEIGFFSGNPSVELTNGIIHLYKRNERKEVDAAPTNKLCLLAVPASLSCQDLVKFIAPCHAEIQHIRIIRDGNPNQFMVLLNFRSNASALEFYQSFNGAPYSSIEPDCLCHAVWVSEIEHGVDGLPPEGHTELPTCAVCLERMDESVDGVLTILCNHAFHTNCLVKWGDSTCPVCRHVQAPELVETSVCMECEHTEALWICLICGHVGCGRYQGGHAAAHFRATNHTYALQLGTSRVWDYAGDNFVHRLLQNKTDGKLVASQVPNDDGEEKVASLQMEFTYLLTSQLDLQRKFYEEKLQKFEVEFSALKSSNQEMAERMTSMEQKIQVLTKEKHTLEKKFTTTSNKLKETQKQLAEECQMSKALRSNQTSWQNKYAALETSYKDFTKQRDAELTEAKEQLRDVMFYMQAQSQIATSELKDDILSGTVIIPEQEESSRNNRRRRKNNN